MALGSYQRPEVVRQVERLKGHQHAAAPLRRHYDGDL
jgi:hypothetical protein